MQQLLCLAFKVCNGWSVTFRVFFCGSENKYYAWKTVWVDEMAKWSRWQFCSIGFKGSTLQGSWFCVVLQVKVAHSPYFQITSTLLWSPHFVLHSTDPIREILMPCSVSQAQVELIKNLTLIRRKIADIMAEIWQLPRGCLGAVSHPEWRAVIALSRQYVRGA